MCPIKCNSSWTHGDAAPHRCRHGHVKTKITPALSSYIGIKKFNDKG